MNLLAQNQVIVTNTPQTLTALLAGVGGSISSSLARLALIPSHDVQHGLSSDPTQMGAIPPGGISEPITAATAAGYYFQAKNVSMIVKQYG